MHSLTLAHSRSISKNGPCVSMHGQGQLYIITLCCWTDISCVDTKYNFKFAWSDTIQKNDQESAKLDLTFNNVDLTNETLIIGPDGSSCV